MSTEYEKLVVLLEASIAKFDKDIQTIAGAVDTQMTKIEQRTASMSSQVQKTFEGLAGSLLSALSVDSLVKFGEAVVENAAQLNAQAQQLGVTTAAMQAYQQTFVQSGSSAEVADNAIAKINKSIGEAALGSSSAQKTFENLNVSWKDLQNTAPDQRLGIVAKALLDVEDSSKRAAVEVELFGRSGQEVESQLRTLAEGVDALKEKFKDSIVDDESAKKATDAIDRLTAAWQRMKVAVTPLFAEIAKFVADLGDIVTGNVGDVQAQIKILDDQIKGNESSLGAWGGVWDSVTQHEIERLKTLKDALLDTLEPGKAPPKVGGGTATDAEIADQKRRHDAALKADEQLKDALRKQDDRAILDQVERDKESVESYANLLDYQQKLHDKTLGEMSVADKQYFSEREKIEEEEVRRTQQLHDQFVKAIVNDVANFGDAMDQAGGKFGKAVETMILDLAKLALKLEATKALEETLGVGKQGGGDPLKSLFGGLLGAVGLSDTAYHLGALDFPSTIPITPRGAFASGGDPPVGVPSMVGEDGPELFVPKVAGTIYPNKTGPGASGNTSLQVVVNGARGNAEIRDMVAAGVQQGIAGYDKVLPSRVWRINGDPYGR